MQLVKKQIEKENRENVRKQKLIAESEEIGEIKGSIHQAKVSRVLAAQILEKKYREID